MTKTELIERVAELESELANMNAVARHIESSLIKRVEELESELTNMNAVARYIENGKTVIKSGNMKFDRKGQVLSLLKQAPHSITEIADKLGISNKNVSSQICYLKRDKYKIATNSAGQKFIED